MAPSADPLILLVDDFADTREMCAVYLTFRGYRVLTASNGVECLEVARGPERPDLILMDLQMRGVDGTTAMQLLKRDPAFDGVPIVAYTAHALDSQRQDALRNGFDAFIAKPCLPDELVRRIEPLLKKGPERSPVSST